MIQKDKFVGIQTTKKTQRLAAHTAAAAEERRTERGACDVGRAGEAHAEQPPAVVVAERPLQFILSRVGTKFVRPSFVSAKLCSSQMQFFQAEVSGKVHQTTHENNEAPPLVSFCFFFLLLCILFFFILWPSNSR